MKAIVVSDYGPPDVLTLRDVPDPHPTPSQVVAAAADAHRAIESRATIGKTLLIP